MIQQNVDQPTLTASDSVGRATSNPYRYVPAGKGPAYRSPIDQVRFLVTGEQSGGAFFMAEASVPPGCGNPPHIHSREDETFYLQEGTLTVQVGGRTITASPGDTGTSRTWKARLGRRILRSATCAADTAHRSSSDP